MIEPGSTAGAAALVASTLGDTRIGASGDSLVGTLGDTLFGAFAAAASTEFGVGVAVDRCFSAWPLAGNTQAQHANAEADAITLRRDRAGI